MFDKAENIKFMQSQFNSYWLYCETCGEEGKCLNLRWSDLRGADLRRADLNGAILRGAILRDVILSGVKGLLDPATWIQENFDHDDLGILVYKRIGDTQYNQPEHWIIEPGSFIEEVCNPDRGSNCACGINFGTLEWCRKNYKEADLWLCRIRWIDAFNVVVPFNTDGKARCSRLKLLELIE